MRKTTVYLSDELKARLAYTARVQRMSEAQVIRKAIEGATLRVNPPRPHFPLFEAGEVDPTVAERDEEILAEEFGLD